MTGLLWNLSPHLHSPSQLCFLSPINAPYAKERSQTVDGVAPGGHVIAPVPVLFLACPYVVPRILQGILSSFSQHSAAATQSAGLGVPASIPPRLGLPSSWGSLTPVRESFQDRISPRKQDVISVSQALCQLIFFSLLCSPSLPWTVKSGNYISQKPFQKFAA